MKKPTPCYHVKLVFIVNRLIKLRFRVYVKQQCPLYKTPHGFCIFNQMQSQYYSFFFIHVAHVCSLFCSLFNSFALLVVQFMCVALVCSLFYSFVLLLCWFTLLVHHWHCQFFVLMVRHWCYQFASVVVHLQC